VEQLIRRSGLLELYKDRDSIIARQKQQNLEQMVNAARDYGPGPGGLTAYLEDMNLDNSLGEEALKRGDTPGVTLITMHNTKGLEFDRVIITGLEEGLFPSRRNGGEDEEEKEEERRIFYVSLTRARRELYLTACRRRLIWGRWVGFSPSSFLNELGPENLELHGAPVLQAGGGTGEGRGGWPPGTGVFHGDYGPGVVVKEWHNGRDLLVLVAFDSGKTGQFIPRYTPLERIARD
jgi:DNA helicase-2/ATP-dependent DNA helicase PcrA